MIATPADPTSLPAAPGVAAASAPGRPQTVLVLAEDDATHSAVEMCAGDLAPIIHATNPLDAFRLVADEGISVIVSARRLGSMDLTHLLCLVKRQHPDIVSIVVGEADSSKLLGRLIAEEQIFHFAAKPLKAGSLRPCIKAALDRQATLFARPAARPAGMPPEMPADDVGGALPATPCPSLASRLGSLLRRLLWQ